MRNQIIKLFAFAMLNIDFVLYNWYGRPFEKTVIMMILWVALMLSCKFEREARDE